LAQAVYVCRDEAVAGGGHEITRWRRASFRTPQLNSFTTRPATPASHIASGHQGSAPLYSRDSRAPAPHRNSHNDSRSNTADSWHAPAASTAFVRRCGPSSTASTVLRHTQPAAPTAEHAGCSVHGSRRSRQRHARPRLLLQALLRQAGGGGGAEGGAHAHTTMSGNAALCPAPSSNTTVVHCTRRNTPSKPPRLALCLGSGSSLGVASHARTHARTHTHTCLQRLTSSGPSASSLLNTGSSAAASPVVYSCSTRFFRYSMSTCGAFQYVCVRVCGACACARAAHVTLLGGRRRQTQHTTNTHTHTLS
jgi:hypothetical protein